MAGGWGLASGSAGSGDGGYTQVGVGLAQLSDKVNLRGELMYQRAAVSETPWRDGETRRYGGGLTMVYDLGRIGEPLHVYAPIGLGVLHSRIRTEQRPLYPSICNVDGRIGPCQGVPREPTVRESRDATGVMAMIGVGLSARLRGVNAFVEVRAHIMDEEAQKPASFAPMVIGVSF